MAISQNRKNSKLAFVAGLWFLAGVLAVTNLAMQYVNAPAPKPKPNAQVKGTAVDMSSQRLPMVEPLSRPVQEKVASGATMGAVAAAAIASGVLIASWLNSPRVHTAYELPTVAPTEPYVVRPRSSRVVSVQSAMGAGKTSLDLESMRQASQGFASGAAAPAAPAVQAEETVLQGFVSDAKLAMRDLPGALQSQAAAVQSAMQFGEVQGAFDAARVEAVNKMATMQASVAASVQDANTAAHAKAWEFQQAMDRSAANVQTRMEGAAANMQTSLQGATANMQTSMQGATASMQTLMQGDTANMQTSMQGASSAAQAKAMQLQQTLGEVEGKAQSAMDRTAANMQTSMQGVNSAAQQTAARLQLMAGEWQGETSTAIDLTSKEVRANVQNAQSAASAALASLEQSAQGLAESVTAEFSEATAAFDELSQQNKAAVAAAGASAVAAASTLFGAAAGAPPTRRTSPLASPRVYAQSPAARARLIPRTKGARAQSPRAQSPRVAAAAAPMSATQARNDRAELKDFLLSAPTSRGTIR